MRSWRSCGFVRTYVHWQLNDLGIFWGGGSLAWLFICTSQSLQRVLKTTRIFHAIGRCSDARPVEILFLVDIQRLLVRSFSLIMSQYPAISIYVYILYIHIYRDISGIWGAASFKRGIVKPKTTISLVPFCHSRNGRSDNQTFHCCPYDNWNGMQFTNVELHVISLTYLKMAPLKRSPKLSAIFDDSKDT